MATAIDHNVRRRPIFEHIQTTRSIRGAAKALARNLGYDIRQIGTHHHKRPADFIRSRNVDLVIDVGANIGQYAEAIRYDGYDGWIVSFEPTSAAYEPLALRAAKDHNWKVMKVALGEQEGVGEINVSEASDLSSFLTQLPTAQGFYPSARVLGHEKVRVARLDRIFAELPSANTPFLKIDTQGFEQQVLLGASDCLSRFVGIQLELPIVHLYEGTWRFHEAIAFMQDRGFIISNITPVGHDIHDTVSFIEFDCIFRRAG